MVYPQVRASSGRPRRWYYLNRFTLSTTSSPTLVGFFVCGMMCRFGYEYGNRNENENAPNYIANHSISWIFSAIT
jgi:hypothetical protein